MAFNRYAVGSSVTITGTYTNAATGAKVDPSDACVDVVKPNRQTATYKYSLAQVVRVSAGVYTLDLDTTALPGRWQYRWWSPANTSIQTAAMNEFYVDPFPAPTP